MELCNMLCAMTVGSVNIPNTFPKEINIRAYFKMT